MSHESTPASYDWAQLAQFAASGRAFEERDTAQRAKIRDRLDQALERLRVLEHELQEIRDDLEAI